MELVDGKWLFPELIAMAYTLPRMFAMFSLLPMFNRQALPVLLRAGVAASIAVFIVPTLVEPANAVDRTGFEMLAVIVKEAGLGFIMGFIIAIPIWAFEMMGDFIDNQRGASIAQTLSPMTGHDTSPLGDLFSQACVIFLFISGGFLLIVASIIDSYRIFPVFAWWPHFDVSTPTFLLGLLDRLMRLAVLMGAPVIIAMFLSEVGLALVSRFAPQLQVFFLAMPIKSGLAIFVLAVYTGTLFDFAGIEMADIGNQMLTSLSTIFN
ncbi:MAG: EscT/YscT/HrcT family type secretion system export apparatus protein [Herminiimonas sp.]|nr:EscT/YscT/HrcT family type secretion system export apparatus protein [Herminiimonas sp.]